MKVFIPITDEMLEKGMVPDELIAYQAGMPLLSQAQTAPLQSRSTTRRSPSPTPSSDAVPALSSSTYLAGAALG